MPRASLALALQLLRRAKRQGLQPDAATYTALLGLCARAGRSRTAVRLHKVHMPTQIVTQARRSSSAVVCQVVATLCLEPGQHRYASVALQPRVLVAGRQTDAHPASAGDRVPQDMERRGVRDDRFTCICVMEALAAEGLVRLNARATTHLWPMRRPTRWVWLSNIDWRVPERQPSLRLSSWLQVVEAAAIWRTMVWGPRRRRPDRQVCLHIVIGLIPH